MENADQIQVLIEAYLRGDLDEASISTLKAAMEADPELAKEVREFEELYRVLAEDNWDITKFDSENPKAKNYLDFFMNKENKAYFEKIKALDFEAEAEQSGVTKRTNIKALYSALALAAVIVLSLLVFNPFKSEVDPAQIADAYFSTSEVPSMTTRSPGVDSLFSKIEIAFNQKKYVTVNDLINQNETIFTDEETDLVYIYQGVAYSEQGLHEKAQEIFTNKAIYKDSFYQQMADWYLTLSLLKSNNIDQAKEYLVKFSKDSKHYKQAQSIEILKKLR